MRRWWTDCGEGEGTVRTKLLRLEATVATDFFTLVVTTVQCPIDIAHHIAKLGSVKKENWPERLLDVSCFWANPKRRMHKQQSPGRNQAPE